MTLRRGGPSRLTWRRFRLLLNGLPPESRYQTALRNSLPKADLSALTSDHDPTRDRWSKVESLLAGIDDRLQMLLIAVISACGGEPPQFQPVLRPGVARPDGPRPETPEEQAIRRARMEAQIDGTRKRPPAAVTT